MAKNKRSKKSSDKNNKKTSISRAKKPVECTKKNAKESKKTTEHSLFPSEFDKKKYKSELKIYKHLGKSIYKSIDGKSHCSDYDSWAEHFKMVYNSINQEKDKKQLQWALRDKKADLSHWRNGIIGIFVVIILFVIPPFVTQSTNIAASIIMEQKIENTSDLENTNENSDQTDDMRKIEMLLSSHIEAEKEKEQYENLKINIEPYATLFFGAFITGIASRGYGRAVAESRFIDEALRLINKDDSDDDSDE